MHHEKNSQNIYIGNEINNLIKTKKKIVTNTNLPNLKNFTNDEIGLIKRRITREKSDLIFSSEGYYHYLKHKNYFNFLTDLVCPENSKRVLEILMFIRPPARWINSAWWQWGAWDSKKQDFDNWLVSAIKKTNWHKYILMLLNYKNINKFSIYPLSNDVIEQLHSYLKLNSNIKKISETNNSLPKEALKFFLDNRSYRPSAHQNKNESKISELIEKRNYKFNPPWVLNQSHLRLNG